MASQIPACKMVSQIPICKMVSQIPALKKAGISNTNWYNTNWYFKYQLVLLVPIGTLNTMTNDPTRRTTRTTKWILEPR
jgi:hypothetical protein